jgi:hypothetical protein
VRLLTTSQSPCSGRMWADLVAWGRQYLLRPEFELASPDDLRIAICVDTAEEEIAIIRRHHEEWLREPGARDENPWHRDDANVRGMEQWRSTS